MNFWNILNISPTTEKKQVKRAYAKLLKQHKPEQDPEGYQRLREAFDAAILYCKNPSTKQDLAWDTMDQTSSNSFPTEQSPPIKSEITEQEINQEKAISKQIEVLLQQIFSEKDSQVATLLFQQAIQSDLLLNLKYRHIFEMECLYIGGEWSPEHLFPGALFNTVIGEFGWFNQHFKEPQLNHYIDYLKVRIAEYNEYLILLKVSKKKTFFGFRFNSHKIWASRRLLGNLHVLYFQLLAFFLISQKQIKLFLVQFSENGKLSTLWELNTPSFHWWFNYYQKYHYNVSHLSLGMLFAFMPSLFLPENTTWEERVIVFIIYSLGLSWFFYSISKKVQKQGISFAYYYFLYTFIGFIEAFIFIQVLEKLTDYLIYVLFIPLGIIFAILNSFIVQFFRNIVFVLILKWIKQWQQMKIKHKEIRYALFFLIFGIFIMVPFLKNDFFYFASYFIGFIFLLLLMEKEFMMLIGIMCCFTFIFFRNNQLLPLSLLADFFVFFNLIIYYSWQILMYFLPQKISKFCTEGTVLQISSIYLLIYGFHYTLLHFLNGG